MDNGNFYATLKEKFSRSLENPFLTMPYEASFSYDDIDNLSAKIATALLESGATAGDRIVVQVEKSPANVALYFAAMRAGLVYVPLNTAYTAEELDYFLSDADPTVFICDPLKQYALSTPAQRAGVATLMTLGADGKGTLTDAAKHAAAYDEISVRHSDDLAVILYTSGTTGRSKGAMLTHANLQSNAAALNSLWEFTSRDVLLHALPVFHIHGLFVALHTAMLSAAEILFLPKFDLNEVRDALPRASIMMGVPTFYSRLLGDPEFGKSECTHMRLFISGSAPLTAEAFSAFEARTGHKILERYGMSEAGMIASNPLDGARIPGTVGFPLPGVSIRIQEDAGEPVPAGKTGNVEVKGPNIFKGYWRNPQKTVEEFTSDGFFKTGDNGSLDQTGRLTLMGRSKDLIITGGYNIYPKEIEGALDAIDGVTETAVIGAPHPDMGEGVVAVMVAENAAIEDAIIKKALDALANFKRPRKFFWLDTLPRNAMGKVQKQILRERYKDVFEG